MHEHIKKVEGIPASDEDGKGKKYFSELEVMIMSELISASDKDGKEKKELLVSEI